MDAIKATWKNGQILPLEPVSWPDGSQLIVEPIDSNHEKIGLTEDQWRDDPEALADWDAWPKTIKPCVLSDEERAEHDRYQAEVRRFNLEAVRRLDTPKGFERSAQGRAAHPGHECPTRTKP